MVERSWLDESYNDPFADTSAIDEGKSALDFPINFGKRAAGIGADLGAIIRSIGEEGIDPKEQSGRATAAFGNMIQTIFGEIEEGAEGMLSPAAQRSLQLTATSPEFYQLGNLMLQGAGMAPDVVAAVIPAFLFPGTLAAAGIAASQGAALGAGEITDELYRITDNMTDADLMEEVPYYRDLREKGMDEENARIQWNNEFRGNRAFIAGLVGAVSNTLGPAGQAARIAGGVGRGSLTAGANAGAVRRTATGLAEGFASETVEEGTQATLLQGAEIDVGRRDGYNLDEIGEAALTGGVLGGLLGGGISGVAGGRRKQPGKAGDPVDAMPGVNIDAEMTSVSPSAPNQPGGGVVAAGPTATPAAGAVPPSTAQPAATRTRRTPATEGAPLADPVTVSEPALTPVDVAGPAPDVALAISTQLSPPSNRAADPSVTAPAMEAAPPMQGQPAQEVPGAPPAAQVPVTQGQPPVETAPVAPVGPVTATPPVGPAVTPESNVAVRQPVSAPAVQPTGPRVLEDTTGPDYGRDWDRQNEYNVARADFMAKGPEALIAPEDEGGSNFTPAEKAQRAHTQEKSVALFGKYKPREEENGILSTKPAEVTAAKALIMARAKAIYQDVVDEGVVLPERFRDTKDKSKQYPAETITLMEARRLATKDKPTLADYRRFREQEVRVGLGRDEAAAARRTDGDAAMKRGVAKGEDSEAAVDAALSKNDTAMVSDALTSRDDPESLLIASDDLVSEMRDSVDAETTRVNERFVDDNKSVTKATDANVPRMIQQAVDDAIEQVMRAPAAPKVVERVKRRKVAKPATKPEPTPAVTKRIAEVKLRVAAARAETETNPTQSQKLAGNYKKGSVSISGMTVRIENPVGSTRTNSDPDGPAWSVKMRNDYGYLEGTKGADGDPIDVYIGPDLDSTYVWVVDQVDPDTRVFDEHKVMLGFKSEQAAYVAYNHAFSDGSGALRGGGFRRMSMAEFKKWANTDPDDRASMSDTDAAEIQAYVLSDALETAVGPVAPTVPAGYAVNPYNGRSGPVVSTRSAREVIAGMDVSSLSGFQRAIAGQTRRMMSELVGDTPVHFVTPEVIQHLSGETFAPKGLYSSGRRGPAAIFVRSDLMGDPDAVRHAVLHEAVHAATLREVRRNPAVESEIRDVMNAVRSALIDTGLFFDSDLNSVAYAMSDPGEFVAEVLSNPKVQEVLSRMQAPDALIAQLGMRRGPVRSAWDALIHVIRKALKLPDGSLSVLEAALRVSETAMKPVIDAAGTQAFLTDGNMQPILRNIRQHTNSLLGRGDMQFSAGRPWMIGVRTMDSIARSADQYFGGEANNPFRAIGRYMEARRVRASEHYDKATPMLQNTATLQQRYSKERGEGGKTVWENFTELTILETNSGVFADRPLSEQKHVSKGARDSWKRAQHPELSRRYNALPNDLKVHRQTMLDYFKSEQAELSRKLIRNQINHMFDTPDATALADRVFSRTVTDADKEFLGDYYDTIARAGALGKIDGPYFPLMRRGNWVVSARQTVTTPGNARALSRNEFEFRTEAEAEAYAANQTGHSTVNTVYVDPTTGQTFGVEDNGTEVRLTAQDMNAEARYRVTVQDKHVEMFDSEREARERAVELKSTGLDVDDVVPRKFNDHGAQAEALSPQLMQMMQVMERRAKARNLTDTQVSEMMQATNEMAMQFMAATRIQTRAMPRRNVAGASQDLTRNAHDYALAMGNHVAKLDISPKLDAELARAQEYIDANRQDGMGAARQSIMNETAKRLSSKDPRTEGGFGAAVNRVLAVSFIDKLMSPSYSVINATQPYMITMPYLAGHYGVMRANSAMAKAYRDIGTLQTIREGARATVGKARTGSTIPTDPVSLIMGRLNNASERKMLEYMIEFGALDTDSGLEVARYMKSGRGISGKFDAGVGYLEGIARQMPKSVEAINRSVSALAAYRLEMERSGNHDKAVTFAYDTINKTQFNYSHTNATPYMNHPIMRIATQFKKYGIGMYQHLGEQVGISIDSTRTPQERAAAIKALSMTIGMHVLVAGAMGLPTEPIKMVVTAANAMGIMDWTWEDVEIGQREALAGLLGRDLGEVMARGVPRAFGVDLSSRMGIDTLMGPFGEPRSNEAQDLKSWMWDALAGAPAGLIVDMTGGVKSLAEGDVLRGMEKLVPIKAFADSLKAYRQMSEGTVSQRTGRQILEPYSVGEAIMRGVGFAPAREAEAFERSGLFYRQRDVQEETRKDFMREWTDANSGARGRVWRDIQKWNKSAHRDAKISLSDLRTYQKRIKADIKDTNEGLRARRREQHILDRADSTFNFEK